MAACGSEGRVFSVAGVGSAASLAVFSASCGVLLSFSGMEKAEGVFYTLCFVDRLEMVYNRL